MSERMPGEDRVEITRVVRDFRAIRDVELAQHVAVIGDTVAPFMASPDTDPAALPAADSLAVLPDDAVAAAEEIQRRREKIGFSYFVFGADAAESALCAQRVVVLVAPLRTVGANLGECFGVASSYPRRRSKWGVPATRRWRTLDNGVR